MANSVAESPSNGSIKCMMCDNVVAEVVNNKVHRRDSRVIRQVKGKPRCPRCNGNLYFDRELASIAAGATPEEIEAFRRQ